MKLVLDKFLWLGFIIMAFGLYTMVAGTEKGIRRAATIYSLLTGYSVLSGEEENFS